MFRLWIRDWDAAGSFSIMGDLTVNDRIVAFIKAHRPGHRSEHFAKGDSCATLVQAALAQAKAKDLFDFPENKANTATTDYVWGDPVPLDQLQPGDIVQFKDHVMTGYKADGSWQDHNRPHHSALVVSILDPGKKIEVEEQHIKPNVHKIYWNVVYLQGVIEADAQGNSTRWEVTGQVTGYRAQSK
jgi:cell wall-associated NlpC family hydrolase